MAKKVYSTFKILFSVLMLVLAVPSIHAQSESPWLHPTLTASAYIHETYDATADKMKNTTLSSFGANFNPTGKFRVSLAYDVVIAKVSGYEFTYAPSPRISFTAGLQKMPYLQETSVSPRVMEAVFYSQSSLYLGGYARDLSGVNSRSRDMGISVDANIIPGADNWSMLRVIAGVFNGAGYSLKDDNNVKNFEGRLLFKPIKPLTITFGSMIGKYNLSGEGSSAVLADRNRLTAALYYEDGKYFFKAEDIYGKTDNLKSNGFYALTGYYFNPKMALSARVDSFKKDISDKTTSSTEADICFSHFLRGTDLSYRLQYGHMFYSDGVTSDVNKFIVCLILRFSRKI